MHRERAWCADGEEEQGALPDGVEESGWQVGRSGGVDWAVMESFVEVGIDLMW